MIQQTKIIKKNIYSYIYLFILWVSDAETEQIYDMIFWKSYIQKSLNISMPVSSFSLQLSEISTLLSQNVLPLSSPLISHLSVTGSVTLLPLSHTNDDSDVALSYICNNGQNPDRQGSDWNEKNSKCIRGNAI